MHFEQPDQPDVLIQTDAVLYQALRAGQTDVLGVLYDRHAGLVYGLALKVLGNAQEAEDLTQEIFLTLVRGCSYDPSRGALRTFLAILTRSRAIDRIRARQTTVQTLGKWRSSQQEVSGNSPVEYVAQVEQSQEVQAALAQLSVEQQQVLKMAYYDGLSQSAIAEQLQLPLGTVKARARRGLLKLRQTLADFIK
ncbi:MAG: sigma-70 family RNA polymerase sigma factor [Leptolyngbyaceae cyanobacterium SL_7_1]|nr:sigma-70 family RNA polymerase sigma factor [Leptolyngbyaceae cyanobacterium SL_7_1]